MWFVTEHGAFPDKIALAKTGNNFLNLTHTLENLDLAGLNDGQFCARFTGAIQELSQFVGPFGNSLGNVSEILFSEVLKQNHPFQGI